MVSAAQQHEHCVRASHATCSELTRDVATVLRAVMRATLGLWQKLSACLARYELHACTRVRWHRMYFCVLAAAY